MRGGYTILDFKNVEMVFDDVTTYKFKGIFEKIESSLKPLVVTNINIINGDDDSVITHFNSAFVTCLDYSAGYYYIRFNCNEIFSLQLQIDDEDNVKVQYYEN